MKKRYYFPDRIAIIVLCVFLLMLGLLPLCESIRVLYLTFSHICEASIKDTIIRIAISIILILPMLLLGYKISQYFCYTIILDKNGIHIHEDTNLKISKIQYFTSVYYNQIYGLDIIWSNRKSNGEKSSEHSITGGETKIPYLRIITKSGEQKLFMIMFTSKKTINKMILEILRRSKDCGNVIQITDIESITKTLKN